MKMLKPLKWFCKKFSLICPNCDHGILDYQGMGEIESYTDKNNLEKMKITEYAICHNCSKIYKVWRKEKKFLEISQAKWEKIQKENH